MQFLRRKGYLYDSCDRAKRRPDLVVERGQEAARIITVASGKGGVGKTHMAINLAHAMVRSGQRVLLIDGDLGLANVNVMLGLSPDFNAGHLLSDERTFEQVITPVVEGLDLMPAGSALAELAELDMAGQVHLMEKLALHQRAYDLILLDASGGIGGNVRLAVSMAHEVLLVMNPETTSLTDAYALVKVASQCGSEVPFHVVVNRVRLAEQAREIFSCLDSASKTFLGVEVGYAGYVYQDHVVERALRAQKPFVESFPDAPASRCVEALAKRLLGSVEATKKI